MSESLQEFITSRGVSLRVDRQAGVIRGVKVLGLESQNGRSYLPEALAAAAPLYEGAKVNVNHPKSFPSAPRDYQDRLGAIHNVALRGNEGLFADLHFNPQHALAGQLAWDAEHAPENVGFSHNVLARMAKRGERTVVEAITKVQSVDLVADPATTRGLFESASLATPSPERVTEEARHRIVADLTASRLIQLRPDLVAEIATQLTEENAALRGQLDALRAAEAIERKRAAARRCLAEFQLPDPASADAWGRAVVSEAFVASLLAAPDETAMRRLVEERANLLAAAAGWNAVGLGETRFASARRNGVGQPISREQYLVETDGRAEMSGAEFARAIT